jgi:hypothetical protein
VSAVSGVFGLGPEGVTMDVYDASRAGQAYDAAQVTMVVCVRPGCGSCVPIPRTRVWGPEEITRTLLGAGWRQLPQPFSGGRAEHGDPANHVEIPAFECLTCAGR